MTTDRSWIVSGSRPMPANATGEKQANSVGTGRIIDGSITAADLAPKSATMDKTSGPLGASYTNVAIAASSSAYVYPSPSIVMDSPGTCVFTATARTTTSWA